MTLSRLLRAGALLAACASPLAPVHAAALPPASAFFNNSNFGTPKLSPSGRYLATRVAQPGGRFRLSVVNLADMSVAVVAMFDDADIGYFDWVNDQRLVFNTGNSQVTASDERMGSGLYAVNRDGTGYRQLVNTSPYHHDRLLDFGHFPLGQPGKQDSDEIYVVKVNGTRTEVTNLALLRLNTVTGRTTAASSPGQASGFLLDQDGEPRLASNSIGSRHMVYLREGETWTKLLESELYGTRSFTPVGFGPDGALYVSARRDSDKTALYRYDTATKQIAAEPLVAMDGYDFLPDSTEANGQHLVVRDNKLVGVYYSADVDGVAWLDAKGKALQDKIDQLLPGLVNLVSLPRRAEVPWVLVSSYSDVQPPVHLLYNTESGKLTKVSASRDAINPAQMGRQELVHYKARDGLDIPALVTYPRGGAKKNLPMVVLVHGGPNIHGSDWGWRPDTQFLASRGYMVLEPAFRGSTGYGWKHFRAGWKQWGLGMQDDIADGTRWAIAQGYADPKRICIAGASYGGYATLMGLVNDPDLYKCGVEWAGVTDINLMYTGAWSAKSDLGDRWKNLGMPVLIGDPVADAAQLKATSPLEQAARIKQPLLMAYGGDDQRVPIYHGEKFLAAVKAGNPNVEWIVYEKEGHGWRLPQNRVDFWGRVERFLQKNIGTP